MPCPHNEITIVQRSQRQSAVAAAAYQSGEKLFCEYDQQVKHYPEKRGIVHNEILLPPNAPQEYADRNTLWNAAEAVEKQWNSQLARRWVLTIPREIPPDQYAVLVREFCQKQFVSKGMIADFAIHDPHPPGHNPHAHVMLTMRAIDEHGKWLPKSRKVYDLDESGERIKLPSGRWKSHKEDTVDWNDQKYCEIWRHEWEVIQNRYLGPVMQNIMRVFSVVLLIMVGTVFAVGPAGLIVTLCKNGGMSGVLTTTLFWLIIILVYYFIATFISIDAIIGKIYPVFGICLIIMAVGVIFGIFTNPAYTIPEIWANFSNMHPSNTPIWSFMFITVACGAISGFHSTQSPLMARCMKSEKQGHFVFYGAMVSEGIIALIWAAAGCALYTITDGKMVGLAEALAAGQSAAIYDVCLKTMGNVGVALAMIGVVICPITSGDTAFRSARLTLADWLKIDQDSYANRLKLCIPVLGVGAFLGIGNALGFINYTVIWRYFSWTNQTLAMIVLWAASMYLFKEKKNFWITAVPATFMSAVSCTYFVLAPECLGKMINTYADGKLVAYNTAVAYPIGIVFAIAMLALFLHATKKSSTSKA